MQPLIKIVSKNFKLETKQKALKQCLQKVFDVSYFVERFEPFLIALPQALHNIELLLYKKCAKSCNIEKSKNPWSIFGSFPYATESSWWLLSRTPWSEFFSKMGSAQYGFSQDSSGVDLEWITKDLQAFPLVGPNREEPLILFIFQCFSKFSGENSLKTFKNEQKRLTTAEKIFRPVQHPKAGQNTQHVIH